MDMLGWQHFQNFKAYLEKAMLPGSTSRAMSSESYPSVLGTNLSRRERLADRLWRPRSPSLCPHVLYRKLRIILDRSQCLTGWRLWALKDISLSKCFFSVFFRLRTADNLRSGERRPHLFAVKEVLVTCKRMSAHHQTWHAINSLRIKCWLQMHCPSLGISSFHKSGISQDTEVKQ